MCQVLVSDRIAHLSRMIRKNVSRPGNGATTVFCSVTVTSVSSPGNNLPKHMLGASIPSVCLVFGKKALNLTHLARCVASSVRQDRANMMRIDLVDYTRD